VAVYAAAIFPIIVASIVVAASEIESTVVASAVIEATAMVTATTSTVMGLSRRGKAA
jgi:alpha-D-ribose 1-methylphosphonate 5-triphosphate diphosphatase PhnM